MRFTDEHVTVYRVRQGKPWWRPTWQAEWNRCFWCPRAFTERGAWRRAERWMNRGEEWLSRHARRRQWIRAHVTRRSDDYYKAARLGGNLKGAWWR